MGRYITVTVTFCVNLIAEAQVYLNILGPIPGGCNEEFPVPVDPNLWIDKHSSDNLYTLRFQYAKGGTYFVARSSKEILSSIMM